MLKYQTISKINEAQHRIKRDSYRWASSDDSRDRDELLVFTFGSQALDESQQNLELCISTARSYDMDLVIIKDSQIQLAGSTGHGRHRLVANSLFSDQWLQEYSEWLETSHRPQPLLQQNRHGECVEFYSYRHGFCTKEHQGVYDVSTGRRLTNRREIIQRIWDLGFASHRGRPMSVARLKWTGDRDELKEITELADRYWDRQHITDVAKKIVSAYRSINRYAAWPGAW